MQPKKAGTPSATNTKSTQKPGSQPRNSPTALLLFIHGFSDHSNGQHSFFPTLASRGIQVHAFDQRGWGRSVQQKSQRGLTGPTTMVLDDITSVLESQIPIAKEKGMPLFLMGHSMGGAEVLQYAARGPEDVRSQIRGYIAEAPYLALHPSSQPSRFMVISGKMAARVLPKRQMVTKLDSKWISRDSKVNREYEEDELCHDTGTLEGLAGMLARGDELDKDVVVLKEGNGGGQAVSLFVAHGDGDRVTCFETSKRWFDRLDVKDKEFKRYDGWYHKLHAEPGDDKITFANDVADWIFARTGSSKISGQLESQSKL
ncbi:hypothetical protein ACLMJK_006866 [Lecanora helva]